MYRVVAYYNPPLNNHLRLYRQDLAKMFASERIPNIDVANQILDTLLDSNLFQGGRIEKKTDIGWILMD